MDAPISQGIQEGWFLFGNERRKVNFEVYKLSESFAVEPLLQESLCAESAFWEIDEDEAAAGTLPHQTDTGMQMAVDVDAGQPNLTPCWQLRRPEGCTSSFDHARRKWARERDREQNGHVPRSETLKKHVLDANVESLEFDTEGVKVTFGAYSAVETKQPDARAVNSVEKLVTEHSFRYVEWKGIMGRVYTDSKDRICAILAGRPDDPKYLAAADSVYDLMKKEALEAGLTNIAAHRRGHFPAVNVGITHGNGTDSPINLDNGKYTELVNKLLCDQNVKRLAGFASACFQMWMPKVYGYYRTYLDKLFSTIPSLRRIFPRSIFPTAAFNFGPNVWTFRHKDKFNCPFGMCAIQALGRFNPTKGGHIILWELKLIIEFPPASTILIPSATISHSNIPVADGDERASFTQYCPGGLFRYVDAGFRKEKDLRVQDPILYEKLKVSRGGMWRLGLELWSRPMDFH